MNKNYALFLAISLIASSTHAMQWSLPSWQTVSTAISTTCTEGKELVGSLSKKLVQSYQQSALKPGIDYASGALKTAKTAFFKQHPALLIAEGALAGTLCLMLLAKKFVPIILEYTPNPNALEPVMFTVIATDKNGKHLITIYDRNGNVLASDEAEIIKNALMGIEQQQEWISDNKQ